MILACGHSDILHLTVCSGFLKLLQRESSTKASEMELNEVINMPLIMNIHYILKYYFSAAQPHFVYTLGVTKGTYWYDPGI